MKAPAAAIQGDVVGGENVGLLIFWRGDRFCHGPHPHISGRGQGLDSLGASSQKNQTTTSKLIRIYDRNKFHHEACVP